MCLHVRFLEVILFARMRTCRVAETFPITSRSTLNMSGGGVGVVAGCRALRGSDKEKENGTYCSSDGHDKPLNKTGKPNSTS